MAEQNIRSDLVHDMKTNERIQLFMPDKKKIYLETRLDVLVQDIITRITKEHGLKHISLITGGKTLVPEKRLNEQNVKNNSKVMVRRLTEPEKKEAMVVHEDRKKSMEESLRRTQKGFQILSQRDDSEDPMTIPFLEIADQKGSPLTLPPSEEKAMIQAMGFHEKGRAMMKRKQHEAALTHLLHADEEFHKCDPLLLGTVDNYAVLQLDIVWCYLMVEFKRRGMMARWESSNYLTKSKQRLQSAQKCFLNCYGVQHKRLLEIKGSSGGEDVLLLRLYLLQSLHACLHAYFIENHKLARQELLKVEELYERLRVDEGKLSELKDMDFTDLEARMGLRACHGDVSRAAEHIRQRREMRQKAQEERRERMQGIKTLVKLGFTKREASEALHKAKGDLDKAYGILLDTSQPMDTAASSSSSISPPEPGNQSEMDQLVDLSFDREVEPSTSSEFTGTAGLEADLVNEVLEDIPQHEEDYLDMTLDEESEVIAQLKSDLERVSSTTC